jgi:hypothetical protein
MREKKSKEGNENFPKKKKKSSEEKDSRQDGCHFEQIIWQLLHQFQPKHPCFANQ